MTAEKNNKQTRSGTRYKYILSRSLHVWLRNAETAPQIELRIVYLRQFFLRESTAQFCNYFVTNTTRQDVQ